MFKKIITGFLCVISLNVLADNVLIVDPNYGGVATNVEGRLVAAGHSVTTVTSAPTSLTGYQQVWDLRYASALTSNETTLYTSFITNGGFAYFVTENPGCCMSRNNSIAALVTALGGGTTTIGGNGNNWAANVESNVNTTYMTSGITVNYAAVAAIVNSQGIPLISDSSGQVSGMSWIGRAGALSSSVTGTIVTVADINWLDSTRFNTSGTTAQTQNVTALDDIIRGIVAGTVAGTISSSGNGAGATNGNTGSSTPTVVSSSTTNTVTSVDTRGQSSTTVTTIDGTSTSTDVVTRGTPVAVVVETIARGTQSTKTLAVSQTFTTTTTTPVTTVTTTVTPFTTTTVVTTPVTTTTTTTPVTTDTMSDNSTVVTTGTPVVTTSTVNEIVTTTTTGTTTATNTVTTNDVVVTSLTNNYSTRIDQFDKLARANLKNNRMLDSGVFGRIDTQGDHFIGMDGPQGYVVTDFNRSNTIDSYKSKSNRFGVGFDHRVDSDLIVGVQYNRHTNTLTGDNAGGNLTKDHFGVYSLHNFNGWLIKNDIGYAFNRIETNHSLPQLGFVNAARTNGRDYWLASRLYTPDINGFRPFVGVRGEHNQINAVTESGSPLTSITYPFTSSSKSSEEVGLNYTQKFDDIKVSTEVARNTIGIKQASLNLTKLSENVSVAVNLGRTWFDGVTNNTVGVNLKVRF